MRKLFLTLIPTFSPEGRRQLGQSIIELVAVVAIGTILILALVALSTRANRGADFSKASNKASQLAAEGIEIVKSIKGANGSVYYNAACDGSVGTGYNWNSFFSLDINETACGDTLGKKGYVILDAPGGCPNWCMSLNSNITYPSYTVDKRTFVRQVYVADTPPTSQCNASGLDFNKIKQFTVLVSWSDPSGSHSSTNTTCLKVN